LISGFCHDFDEICLLGYYTAWSGNPLLTFQDNVSVPSSGLKKSNKKLLFLDSLTLEDGTNMLVQNVGKELPFDIA
jgi:hypothetical protein